MSNMPWLRLYSDIVDNEKIRLLSYDDRWHFIAILCCKQQGILDEKSDLTERKLAVKLGVQLRELDEIKRRLMEVELIDEGFNPVGWDSKQFKSDSSAERVRKYRENNKNKTCNVTETLPERNSNAVDTDTDTEDKKTCSEQSSEPALFNLPLNKTDTFHPITKSDLAEYSELYPNAEVEQEIRKMIGWLNGNKRKRKTKAGIGKFIHAWLSKEQDKPKLKVVGNDDLYGRYYQ